MNSGRENSCLLAILFVAAVFLFANLGNRYLWQDECSVALGGRSILKTGLPLAWDGRNLVECWNGNAFNDNFIWNLHPWLPNFLIASSFACLGESALSARLPFAVMGWFSILLLFAWAKEMTKNKEIALIAALIMACSVSFILFSRQCNYYALLIAFSIPIYYSYFYLTTGKNTVIFVIFSIFLFHSNYFSFAVLQTGLLIHFFLFGFNINKFKKLICAYIIIGLLTIPWLVMSGALKNAMIYLLGSKTDVSSLLSNMLQYLIRINNYFFPVLFIPLVFAMLYRKDRRFHDVFIFLLSILIWGFIAFPVFGRFPVRYSIGLIPVFSLFSALGIYTIKVRYRKLGYLVLIAYITTNFFNEFISLSAKTAVRILPGRSIKESAILTAIRHNPWRKDLADIFNNKPLVPLIKEITTDYDGPNEGMVKFLNEHAENGQYILTTYGQNVLAFYTDLKICYIVFSQKEFEKYHAPRLRDRLPSYVFSYEDADWFIPRRNWDFAINRDKQFFLNYFEKKGLKYKRYVLDYPDIRWGNRPEIEHHYFITPRTGDRVEIYRIFKE
jgi:4-amino-4-deoxy-L-arabinose transferase-like glycosyltransferase